MDPYSSETSRPVRFPSGWYTVLLHDLARPGMLSSRVESSLVRSDGNTTNLFRQLQSPTRCAGHGFIDTTSTVLLRKLVVTYAYVLWGPFRLEVVKNTV